MKVTERVRGDAGYPLPLRTYPRMGAILSAGGLSLAAGVEGPLSTLHFLVIVILSEVRTRSVRTESKDLLSAQWKDPSATHRQQIHSTTRPPAAYDAAEMQKRTLRSG